MSSDAFQPADNIRRRRLRFSLRALLLFVTIIAVVAALLTYRFEEARRQHRAVRRLHQYFGAAAYYDYQLDENDQSLGREATPPGPEWLRSLVGIDFLSRVTKVSFWETNGPGANEYVIFRDLPFLKTLEFFEALFRGEGVVHLSELHRLRRLILNRSMYGKENVKALGQLTQLEELSLIEGRFHEDDLLSLRSLKNLRLLDLRSVNTGRNPTYPRISQRTIKQLQAALPDCEIIYDRFAK